MKYLQVPKKNDQKEIYWNGKYITFIVQYELYTQKEAEKNHIPKSLLEEVEVKKTETFWFFGSRFADSVSVSAFYDLSQ